MKIIGTAGRNHLAKSNDHTLEKYSSNVNIYM